MAQRLIVCSVCQINSAETVCFCEFPLITICCSCLSKHRAIPAFHFEQPVSYFDWISKDNFQSCQAWLLCLSNVQKKLKANIASFGALRTEIEQAAACLHDQLETLKRRYIAALDEMTAQVGELIETAIEELSAQALWSPPTFTCPVSQLAWQWATLNTLEDHQLFRTRVTVGDMGEVMKLICVEMEENYEGLPAVSAIFQKEAPLSDTTKIPEPNPTTFDVVSPIQADITANTFWLCSKCRENPLKDEFDGLCERCQAVSDTKGDYPGTVPGRFSDALDAKAVAPTDIFDDELPPALSRHSERTSLLKEKQTCCVACGSEFTGKDAFFFCPGECRCMRCTIEALVKTDVQSCIYCERPFSEEVKDLARKDFLRCHVCGLALHINEMVPKATCGVCWKCIALDETYKPLYTSGKCPRHPTVTFKIDVKHYRDVKKQNTLAACCSQGLKEKIVLNCGHFACGTHRCYLRTCRSCQFVFQ